jgi:hypothetical protein
VALAGFLTSSDALAASRGEFCSTKIERLAADFDFWGEVFNEAGDVIDFRGEAFTQSRGIGSLPETGGTAVYTKTVFVPSGNNTLYVTLSATGDEHLNDDYLDPEFGKGAAAEYTCLVDGAFCNPGTGGAAGSPAGWLALSKLPDGGDYLVSNNCNDGGGGTADCHDNGVYYTWCTSIEPGTHTVQIRLGSSNGGTVFLEKAHYYIDTSCIRGANRCTQAPNPAGED